jgi:hypothetical protein
MREVKESDKLAETLVVRDTFEISAKSIQEFDALMIEIQKKQEQFPQFSMDITCEWETMDTGLVVDGTDKRTIKAKKLQPDKWAPFMNRIRKAEEEILTYLNAGKEEDQEKTIPVFSCNVKLRIEKKDKEAQKALEDADQLYLFTPYKAVRDMDDKERKEFIEQNNGLFQRLMPDGENISKVTFTHIKEDGSKGNEVVLNAK